MSRYSLVNAFLHRGRGEQKKGPAQMAEPGVDFQVLTS